jgi:hypothetical protein
MGDFDILLPDLCFNILHIDIERDRERFRKKHPHHSHVSSEIQIHIPIIPIIPMSHASGVFKSRYLLQMFSFLMLPFLLLFFGMCP